jgi:hypothetical protein
MNEHTEDGSDNQFPPYVKKVFLASFFSPILRVVGDYSEKIIPRVFERIANSFQIKG